jgi:hypothetical protein
LGVSPCFLSKNAQKLPGYIERVAIPAYEKAALGAVLPEKAGAEHLSYAGVISRATASRLIAKTRSKFRAPFWAGVAAKKWGKGSSRGNSRRHGRSDQHGNQNLHRYRLYTSFYTN